jgi:hypothetical protein
MENSALPARRYPAQPAQRAPQSTQVVGTVAAADGQLSIQLTPTQDTIRTAVVRPMPSPYADLPAVSHWYLDRQGVTALLAFIAVAALFITVGWSM